MSLLEPGAFVRFVYRFHTGIRPDEIRNDRKEVLILHPGWQGKVHALDLKRMTAAERAVLTLIMDPNSKGKHHDIPLVNDILRRMDPIEEIKNPMAFYGRFVRVFIRNKDVYRTYNPAKMRNLGVIRKSRVKGQVFNPKPLFRKIEGPPKTSQPGKGTAFSPEMSRRVAQMKDKVRPKGPK